MPSLSVFVLANRYLVMDAPDPLVEQGRQHAALVDHEQRVIWIDPGVSPAAHESVVLRAVSKAWRERVAAMETAQ